MTAQQDTALNTSHSVPRGKAADLLSRYAEPIPALVAGACPTCSYTEKGLGIFINQWIRNHYQVIKQIGAEPFPGPGFWIPIYQRKGGHGSS